MFNVTELLCKPGEIKVSEILDIIIPHLVEDDFIFEKEYKIVESVSAPFGKWP